MTDKAPKKRFGDILIDGGLITATQLQQALDYGREKNIKVGESLQELGLVNEEAIAHTLSKQLKIPFADFEKVVIDPQVVQVIPESIARKFKVIAIGQRPGEILVAFADPLNIFGLDEIGRHLSDKIVTCIAIESQITAAIEKFYVSQSQPITMQESSQPDGDDLAVVNAVNELLLEAVKLEASDIHIEPVEENVRVRVRVDGILRQIRDFPLRMQASLVSRLKIMSQLDIGERRKAQDGRFELPISGQEFDIRISILPLSNGEKIVMRLLDKSKIKIKMEDLGFEKEQQGLFEHHLHQPHEIILVTGPTGSGKTTTLYGALNQINSITKNIVTVEDPVEYDLSGINQVHVNPRAGVTFVSALRSILRQDPDVIMIGEIRDIETAEIAIQSALTGHLVLSTLHTNNACGAVARLLDMSIPPFLIASSLGLVLAQRLLRKLCHHCRQPYQPPEKVKNELGLDGQNQDTFYKPVGCPQCDTHGYRGRIAIYEILSISQQIEMMIMNKASSHELSRQAQQEGMVSLRRAGTEKVLSGVTSLEEVLRITSEGV